MDSSMVLYSYMDSSLVMDSTTVLMYGPKIGTEDHLIV